jgi:lysophospholipase L1-like esterase
MPNPATRCEPNSLLSSGATARVWLALWLVLLLAAGCGTEKLPPLPKDAVVLVVGDSISAGFGVDPAQAWPRLLEQLSGWRVVNGGVSGDLSEDALARLPELVEAHKPQLLLLEIGGNDMLRGVPENRIRANLEQMITAGQAKGARVVLMAVPKPSLMGAALSALKPAEFYRAVAESQGVPLLDKPLSEVLSNQQFKLDPLHPNGAGHAELARLTKDGLKEIGLLR